MLNMPIRHPPRSGLIALAILTLLPLAAVNPVQAATFTTNATGRIDSKLPVSPSYDSILLHVQNPAVQTNQLWVNMDVNFNLGIDGLGTWESATWTPLDGVTRRSASMLGTDDVGTPVSGRQITVRNLTLDKTDMDTNQVLLKFQPTSGSASLTLQDSSITGQLVPSLTPATPFNLNASGTSEIKGWQGQLASATSLTVDGALTINQSGNVYSNVPNDALYFNQEQNAATINGGTLKVLDSNVLFGKAPTLPTGDSTVTVSNGGTLQVSNFLYDRSRIETDTVTVTGAGSKLLLDDNTTVTLRDSLILNDGAAVTTGDSGQVTSQGLVASGASTITVNYATNIAKAEGVQTGVVQVNRNASLTVNSSNSGTMGINDHVLFDTSGAGAMGQIHLTGNANLAVYGLGDLDLDHGGILTTTAGSEVNITQNGQMILVTNSQFTNNGGLLVDNGGTLLVTGNSAITGNGYLSISDAGSLEFTDTPAQNSLDVNGNTLDFTAFSALRMSLDPTDLTNDKITVGGNLFINGLSDLYLSVINDKVLAYGTKFALFDYSASQTITGLTNHFNGYANGAIFKLGLNNYEILYRDANYDPSNPTVITLTTVAAPEPSMLLLFGAGLTLLIRNRWHGSVMC